MALYTFYVTIMAVVNLVRYRKYQSPAMSAAKAIQPGRGVVSMLSLETRCWHSLEEGRLSAN